MSLATGPITHSILYPTVSVARGETVTLKSVRLDFSPAFGFQASIFCKKGESLIQWQHNTEFVTAEVESPSILVEHCKEKIVKMRQRDAEIYFLNQIDIKILRIETGFKVILAPKASTSIHQSIIKTTKELAEQLNLLKITDANYPALQSLALAVVEAFSLAQNKTKPLIEEATALSFAHNTVITKHLAKNHSKEINQGELLDVRPPKRA